MIYAAWALVVLAALAGVAVLVKPDLLHWRLTPTQPSEPGDDDREASGDPVEHEGATEKFGDELKAYREMPPAPELVTDTENDLRWGLLWHEFEHDMQAEIDRVFAPYLALPVADDFEELREQTCPKELMPA